MSYILDALRRAEAERQRGAVPGLHAQPVAGTPTDSGPGGPDTAHRAWRPGTWALAGLLLAGLLVAAVGLGWLLKPSPEAVAAAAPAVALPAALRRAVPAVQPQAVGPAGAVAAVRLVAPVAAAVALPLIGPAAGSAVGLASAPPPGWASVATAAPAARPSTGPGAAPARLPTLAELPDALRREVQPLNLGGAVYAEQSPLRIVIVNGQVFHEGDKPLPELQVQQIRLKSVVFSVRGQRFEVPL